MKGKVWFVLLKKNNKSLVIYIEILRLLKHYKIIFKTLKKEQIIMKKTLILSLIAITLLLSSCKKEQIVYSCDDEVNTFVVSNIDSIQSISRDSLATLPLPMQNGIFRGLTPENKVRIYSEKIVELLSTIDPSVGGDYQHLENLVNLLNPSIYLDTILPNTLLVWQAYAKDSLGWSDQKMFAYVETWLMPDEFFRSR